MMAQRGGISGESVFDRPRRDPPGKFPALQLSSLTGVRYNKFATDYVEVGG